MHAGEKRVAASPGVAAQLLKPCFTVAGEKGAGDAADSVLKVRAPEGAATPGS